MKETENIPHVIRWTENKVEVIQWRKKERKKKERKKELHTFVPA